MRDEYRKSEMETRNSETRTRFQKDEIEIMDR